MCTVSCVTSFCATFAAKFALFLLQTLLTSAEDHSLVMQLISVIKHIASTQQVHLCSAV